MGINNKLGFDNTFLHIKWDSKAQVGTIITAADKSIHFFAQDLKTMIKELARIQSEINGNAKT